MDGTTGTCRNMDTRARRAWANPPRSQPRGGDLPRGGSGAVGHAGRARMAVALLLSLVMAVLQPLGTVVAWALEPVDIQEVDTGYYVREWSGEYVGSCYDANPGAGGAGEVYHRYCDKAGNDYLCLDIRSTFFSGPHQGCDMLEATGNGRPFSTETVRRLALAVRWCDETQSGDERVVVRQCLAWRILREAGNMETRFATFDAEGIDMARIWGEFGSWYAAHANEFECSGTVWWTNLEGDQMLGRLTSVAKPGGLRLRKVSARPEVSDRDPLYSLEGACYGVWSDDGEKVAELVCDSDGEATVEGLAPGTYHVHETSASAGFALDRTGGQEAPNEALAGVYDDQGWYAVQVESDSMADVGDDGIVIEQPLLEHVGVLLVKHALELAGAVDGPPLAGAEYELARYANLEGSLDGEPTTVWTVRTNDKGEVDLADPDCLVSGEVEVGEDGMAELRPGTYTLREVGAPAGFAIEVAGDSDAGTWTCVDQGGDGVAPTYSFVLSPGSVSFRDASPAPNLCDRAIPSIGTSLAGANGSKEVSPEETSLTDTVSYQGLVAGLRYVLEGRLILADGTVVATAEVEFVPVAATGSQEVTFEGLDLGSLAGRDVVCLERLTLEGELVASHEDPSDKGQTVRVLEPGPKTKTTARTTLPRTGDEGFAGGVAAIAGMGACGLGLATGIRARSRRGA